MQNPRLHLHPKKNWCNDPNGFLYYGNTYHLFYQYFPYGTEWGTMHWRHVTSDDLMHFRDHGIALYPSKLYDANGCFSGTAIEKDGKMQIYYTGVRYTDINPENIHVHKDLEACQVMMTSGDGFSFDNLKDKKEIVTPGANGDARANRDPKVWQGKDGLYRMILGCKYPGEDGKDHGELLCYISKDSEHFSFVKSTRNFEIGDMWECPDLFEADGQWFLILSPMHTESHGYSSLAMIAPVEFVEDQFEITPLESFRVLDEGRDLYAPQTTLAKDGSRIFTGWIRMPLAINGWRGMFIYPRSLQVKNGQLFTPVLDSIANTFQKEADFDPDIPCRITCTLQDGDSIDIGGYLLSSSNGILKADRSQVFLQNTEPDVCVEIPVQTPVHLDIYTDGPIIEIFVNEGEKAIAQVIYEMGKTISSTVPYQCFQQS